MLAPRALLSPKSGGVIFEWSTDKLELWEPRDRD
jgi:hypothetical protein